MQENYSRFTGAKESVKWEGTLKRWYSVFQEQLTEESHLVPLRREFSMHKKLLLEDQRKSLNALVVRLAGCVRKWEFSRECVVNREEKVAWVGRQIQFLI